MRIPVFVRILILCLVLIGSLPQEGYAQLFRKQKTTRIGVKNMASYDIKKLHFGFILGYNTMDFSIKAKPYYPAIDSLFILESSPQQGFNIGIITNFRLNSAFDLRINPSIYFGDRALLYTYYYFNQLRTEEKHIESNIISFPVNLKYKSARIVNTRAYVVAGGSYNIDLASQAKKKEQLSDEILVKIKKHDFTGEVGVGFDFYLEYFKFATELKMQYGLYNLIERENNIYTNSIDRLHSKMMLISFTFE